jgi:hypothetical protein
MAIAIGIRLIRKVGGGCQVKTPEGAIKDGHRAAKIAEGWFSGQVYLPKSDTWSVLHFETGLIGIGFNRDEHRPHA